MKTVISVPDDVFEAAEAFAERRGLSRSQLYSSAVRAYITERQTQGVTEALNRVYGKTPSGLDPALAALQDEVLKVERRSSLSD